MTSRRTFWSQRFGNAGLELRQWRAAAELGFRPLRCFAEQRASGWEGKQGEKGEEVAAHLIQARGGSGGRDDAGRRERPRGSLQREVGDEHFPNRPLAFSFSFYSSPFPFLIFCFIIKTCSISFNWGTKTFPNFVKFIWLESLSNFQGQHNIGSVFCKSCKCIFV